MFWRRRSHDDFSSEIQAHLDLETDRLIADGWSAGDARQAAARSFGNVVSAKERFYESSRWVWLEQLAQDLRYAWRGLRHSPAFVATTVATLAVGLGLVTVAFTVFNAYFLRPYAVRDPLSLHQVGWLAKDDGGRQFRWQDYEALRGRRDLFEDVTAEHTRFVTSNGRPLAVALVSDNYFEFLGPAVMLGRAFSQADTAAGSALVLSDLGWTRLFSRDPGAIGRAVDINGRAFTVVGVLRPEFTGLGDSPRDAWVPLTAYAAVAKPELIGADQPRVIEIVARLRAGVTAEQAGEALTPLMSTITAARDGREPKREVRAEVRQQSSANPMSIEMLAVIAPVFAAFALVLVTACANVSNVMLARAISRHREIAVRLSLGASRGRVIRQLLTEGLVTAVLSGIAGLVFAAWALRGAAALFASTLPASVASIVRLAPIDIDYRVFLFALGTSGAATLMFALLPALQASRLSLNEALRGQRSGTRRSSRLRSALVVAQVTVSLVLVIVALTLARNGSAIDATDLGYHTAGVLSVNVRGNDPVVPKLAAVLAADPRVEEYAVTGGNPLFVRQRSVAAGPEGSGAAKATRYTFVSPEYFPILRIPILDGRGFRADEASTEARVAVVSAATADAFWPGQNPIGKTIRIERPEGRPVAELPAYTQVTVVGTVPDVVSGMMIDGRDNGHIYLPTSPAHPQHALALLVRGRVERGLNAETVQDLLQRAGPDPQVFEALPLDEMRALQMYPLLAASWVGTLLGAVALALSVSGLYGVLTYMLNQRTREIGIRMALGATGGAVVRLVMAQSARLAGIGAAIGLAVAFGALKVLNSGIRLERISLLDVVAFAGGLALIMAATALAAYYPARRATRVDPAETLRADG